MRYRLFLILFFIVITSSAEPTTHSLAWAHVIYKGDSLAAAATPKRPQSTNHKDRPFWQRVGKILYKITIGLLIVLSVVLIAYLLIWVL